MTTLLDAPPIRPWAMTTPDVNRSLPFSGTLPTDNLTERHRPTTLSEVVGQGEAVFALQTFLDAPYPVAFLFEGPTGVGKTSAARALANDLGVSADWGLHVIKSAEADYEAVDAALRMLRHHCPAGSGWKLVLVDEADLMTPKASHAWLSALEDLPPKSVVVFTTNAANRFPDRFLDRCERVEFASDGRSLAQDAQALVDRIWRAETGREDAPRVADLPNMLDREGRLSFRRAVSALDPLLRALARRDGPKPAGRPAVACPDKSPATIPLVPPRSRKRAPRPESPGVLKLRAELDKLLALDVEIVELCRAAVTEESVVRDEYQRANRDGRRKLRAWLDHCDDEVVRVGFLSQANDDAIDALRDKIARAQ